MSSDGPPILVFACRSWLAADVDKQTLDRLIRRSWRFNIANSVTGMLGHCGGFLKTIIEGHPVVMAGLITSILTDPRHTKLRVTCCSLASRREFKAWEFLGFGAREMPADQNVPVEDTLRAVPCIGGFVLTDRPSRKVDPIPLRPEKSPRLN